MESRGGFAGCGGDEGESGGWEYDEGGGVEGVGEALWAVGVWEEGWVGDDGFEEDEIGLI